MRLKRAWRRQVTIIANYRTRIGRKGAFGGPFAFSRSTTYRQAKGSPRCHAGAKVSGKPRGGPRSATRAPSLFQSRVGLRRPAHHMVFFWRPARTECLIVWIRLEKRPIEMDP